jgi:hypothetical protein
MGASSSVVDYKCHNQIEIRMSDDERKMCYTINFSNGEDSDLTVVKSVTTTATGKTVTMNLDAKTKQLTDSCGNIIGPDGDWLTFTTSVDAITGRLTCPWGEESKESLGRKDVDEQIDTSDESE